MLWKRKLQIGYVMVSKRVSVDRVPVRFMYRESPGNEQDSGWRIFAGDESDEYVNDPKNLSINDPETICQIDPSIRSLLNAPAGTAFERADPKRKFIKSDWHQPEEDQDA